MNSSVSDLTRENTCELHTPTPACDIYWDKGVWLYTKSCSAFQLHPGFVIRISGSVKGQGFVVSCSKASLPLSLIQHATKYGLFFLRRSLFQNWRGNATLKTRKITWMTRLSILEECVKDGSVDTRLIVTTEARLRRLHHCRAAGIEASEEQALPYEICQPVRRASRCLHPLANHDL